jgi:hypothetical protein
MSTGMKALDFLILYAALKRRSSTAMLAFSSQRT